MEVMPVKHLLLQEYASVNGLEPLEPNKQNVDSGESASGNYPLRGLQLYALASETRGQVLTPTHSKPVRLVVSAPPAI